MNNYNAIINNTSQNKFTKHPRLDPKDALGYEARNKATFISAKLKILQC